MNEDATEMLTVPRPLVEATLQLLIQAPAGQVYRLLREWDDVAPGVLVPGEEA